MASGYIINDGQTLRAYVAPVPRMWDALRFEYRPVLAEERASFWERMKNKKAAEVEKETAKLAAAKLVGWDLQDREGEPVPAEAASLLRLLDPLFGRVWRIIFGLDAPDEDPDGDPEEAEQCRKDAEQASREERPVGKVQEERRQGN